MAKRTFSLSILLMGLLALVACGQVAEVTEEVESLRTTTVSQPSPTTKTDSEDQEAERPTTVPPSTTAAEENEPDTAVSETPTSLPLDEFYEVVLRDILTRDPEFATSVGLPDELGLNAHDQLTDESEAFQAETYDLLAEHLATLQSYDSTEQSDQQRISSAILEWYLDDIIRRRPYQYYDYRMSPLFGLPWQFPNLMTVEHPLTNQAEAEAYISRLNQFEEKAEQVIANLEIAEEQGVLPPQWMVDWALNDLRNSSAGSPTSLDFYTHFERTIAGLDNISAADKDRLLTEAETAVAQSIIPGYQKLIAFLQDQSSRANNNGGALYHPDGEAYYQAALRHHTTTDLTADEIHEIGLAEVERIQGEMRIILAELGYAANLPWPQVMRQVDRDSGTLRGEAEILGEYDRLIAEAETAVAPYFDILPQAELVVDTIPSGTAYYLTPALDGSRPGIFYAVVGGGPQSRLRMPTTTYHEAIPGHHFQIGLQGELENVPTFRKVFLFNAYAEGWALYAEQLAAEIGLYDDDPYGNLGRLQMELFRAARLVVDTGIHAKGWSHQEAVDYMIENTGLSRQWIEFEVSRYTMWPGQAASYKIGQLKINELRDLTQQALGDDFDLREFHNVVLQNGALPLSVLEMVVQDYIEANQ